MKASITAPLALSLALACASAQAWTLTEAAKPYKGTTIKAIFLDRPGYAAAIKLLPQFEEQTGIKVSYETVPYENSREREVLSFTSGDELDVVLTDVVWIGEFAGNVSVLMSGLDYERAVLSGGPLGLMQAAMVLHG
jgi:multiple sugar transport system substrate-binding protein